VILPLKKLKINLKAKFPKVTLKILFRISSTYQKFCWNISWFNDYKKNVNLNFMPKNKYSKEILITFVLLIFTLILTVLFYAQLLPVIKSLISDGTKSAEISTTIYLVIAGFIIYGNIIYHLTRLGHYKRLLDHSVLSETDIDPVFDLPNLPTVTYLVPSYKEQPLVIEQTLWSAALQYYPNKRIVLLIDNSPNPQNPVDAKLLEETRKLALDINKSMEEMKNMVKKEKLMFSDRAKEGFTDLGRELSRLEDTYTHIASYFVSKIVHHEIKNHVDSFYVKNIYKKWLEKMNSRKDAIVSYRPNFDSSDSAFIKSGYDHLYAMVNVNIESFERKQFVNLSHEPNKAMNINSYLHLIGKKVRKFKVGNLNYLEETLDPAVKTVIPDSKYVVTLDADSVLTLNYTIKLVVQMELEENEKVAVIQTPYSAYPNAKKPVEIVAGATTDIQYNVHQGFTYYNSTYWVGANAMLRKSALNDIKMREIEGDKVTVKYIQDRTVIEDTESSIDLVHKGWRLYNYPERLAYSSTPEDFGSLIIQRARWANGGLIIFPKLLRYILQKPWDIKRWAEFFIRTNYLISIAGVNIGTLILLIYPFGDQVFTLWLPLAALPYYFLYIKDLKLAGYKIRDIVNVYCLNLILIPINIAGVLKSIEQGITGKKIPFKRTPKINDHVLTEIKFIASLYLLFAYTVMAVFVDAYEARYTHLVFSFVNAAAIFYSIGKFIGFKQSMRDVRTQLFKTSS
jgi:cellulose synthase (UDP-forming)